MTTASLLIGLLATALLVSGCSETEGPLPLTPETPFTQPGEASGKGVEVRAPKGGATLTLRASSAAGSSGTVSASPRPSDGITFTRTVIEPDDDGAAALWEPGDEIKVQFRKGGALYYAILRTEEGGSSEATFTTEDDILEGTDYIFFAPGYSDSWDDNGYSGSRLFEVDIPQSQTAVADGVSAGASVAFARAGSFTDGMSLTFANLPALLRFRLSGGVVSQIKEITLRTTSPVAGATVVYDDSGSPSTHPRPKGEVGPSFSSVTLSGEFEAGREYHIALWPEETGYFEMEFRNNSGEFTVLRSSGGLTLHRSVVTDIGVIGLGDSFRGIGNISTTPVKYLSATEGTKPVSIAVVPEGFTLKELPMYESLAKSALDFLFDTEPYKTYKNRFNAWILKVASNESGAGVTDGNGNVIKPVDNFFGTKWGEGIAYGDMSANNTKVMNFLTANCPDIKNGIHTGNEVPVIMLINDGRYAGMTLFSSLGWSYCMIPLMYNGASIFWTPPLIHPLSESDPNGGVRDRTEEDFERFGVVLGGWRNAVIHEFGHAFGRLSDEYWSNQDLTATSSAISTLNKRQSWQVPYGRNISASYGTTPWDSFLNKRADLMEIDENYSRIGVYQGAMGYVLGIWRSELVSGMIDNRPYFNAWSRYLIVERIMRLSGDISQFNLNYWLERDVTTDPIRDDVGTRSGAPGRSGKYMYYYPHPEVYTPPFNDEREVEEEEYIYVRTD